MRLALGTRGVAGELQDLERAAGVPSGAIGDEDDELVGEVGLERRRPAPHDLGELVLAERVQLDHRAP